MYGLTTEEIREFTDNRGMSLEEWGFNDWLKKNNRRVWKEGAESAFFNPEIRGQVDYPENPYGEE